VLRLALEGGVEPRPGKKAGSGKKLAEAEISGNHVFRLKGVKLVPRS